MEKMTVEQLIIELEKMPQDMQVVLSSDEEGNNYYQGIYPERQNGFVVLYPGGYPEELDEIEGYENSEETEEE
jgi:hypothetical protein